MARNFGNDLVIAYLNKVMPLSSPPEMETVTAGDIAPLFFDNLPVVAGKARDHRAVWDISAPKELDALLMRLASNGEHQIVAWMTPFTSVELWRRWSYATMALTMEGMAGTSFKVKVPKQASMEIRCGIALYYCLGGPCRSYPKDFFEGKEP